MNGFFRTLMLVGALASGMAALAVLPARALVEIDVNKGNIEPLPIALPDFVSADGVGAEITAIVAADLKRCLLYTSRCV